MPAILELRIRACHVRGSFECKRQPSRRRSRRRALHGGAGRRSTTMRLAHPPVDLPPREAQGRRAHAGGAQLHRRAGAERALSTARTATSGIIVQGGLYNALIRALQQLGPGRCVRRHATSRCWCSTSTYPLVPERDRATSAPASARCWWSRKASPSSSSRRSRRCCAGATCRRRLHGKDLLPTARRVHGRGDRSQGSERVPRGSYLPQLGGRVAGAGSTATVDARARPRRAARRRRCRRARRPSASAAPSGRCSRR